MMAYKKEIVVLDEFNRRIPRKMIRRVVAQQTAEKSLYTDKDSFYYHPKKFELKLEKRIWTPRLDVHDWYRVNNALTWRNYIVHSIEYNTDKEAVKKAISPFINESYEPYLNLLKNKELKKLGFFGKVFHFAREEYYKPTQGTKTGDLIIKKITYVPSRVSKWIDNYTSKYEKNANKEGVGKELEDELCKFVYTFGENTQIQAPFDKDSLLTQGKVGSCVDRMHAFNYDGLHESSNKMKKETLREAFFDIWDNILKGFYSKKNINSKLGDLYDIIPAWYNWHYITRYRGRWKGVRKKVIKAQNIEFWIWLYDNKILRWIKIFNIKKWLFTLNWRSAFDWDRLNIAIYVRLIRIPNFITFMYNDLGYLFTRFFLYYIPAILEVSILWIKWIINYFHEKYILYAYK